MSSKRDLAGIMALRDAAVQGDSQRVAKQHEEGKQTARERVSAFLDQGSFVEFNVLMRSNDSGTGVITGYGTLQDRPVYLFAQEYTEHGGAMGEQQAKKIMKVLEAARKNGAPIIAMLDSAGIRLDEGAAALSAYASVLNAMARMSGVCPTLAMVLGPCVGTMAMLAELCDACIMTEGSGSLMLHGAQVVNAAFGTEKSAKELGGAAAMARQGVVTVVAQSEKEAFDKAKEWLSYLPSCNMEDAPIVDTDDMNRRMSLTGYDKPTVVLDTLCDSGKHFPLNLGFGSAIHTAFGRLGGRAVGFVMCDGSVNEGRITVDAAVKAARFVRLCDCYQIPVVSFIDSVGMAVESAGNQAIGMKAAAQLVYAFAEATCPKVSVVAGNAIGQAYVAMGTKATADITYAWPDAVISALTPEVAAVVLYSDEIEKSKGNPVEVRAALQEKYAGEIAGALSAAESGMVDDIVDPAQTRQLIISALEMLAAKRDANPPKKHGNLPL